MEKWQKLLNSIDCPGGHTILLAIFAAAGIVVYLTTKDKMLVEMFVPAMLLAMKGMNGQKQA